VPGGQTVDNSIGGKRNSSIILDGWRRSQSEAVSVAGGGCLHTMPVHYMQGVVCATSRRCLHGIHKALIGIPIRQLGYTAPTRPGWAIHRARKLIRWRDPSARKHSRLTYWRRADSHSTRAIRSSPSRWLVAKRCVIVVADLVADSANAIRRTCTWYSTACKH